MLRNKYLKRRQRPTFQSVILTGVYDIRNLKLKVRPEKEHQKNSPWNIAAKFSIDMSFSKQEISVMLEEYTQYHQLDMDVSGMAQMIYDYTSGYSFLVSNICKIIDEEINEKFIEDNGRKIFLLYLKPIINGVGNYYIESHTRDNRRTDIIVDYRGKQYIVEIKIWHENEYNQRGEAQIADYLEAYHAQKGYLLSFNFNKNKVIGTKEIQYNDKVILEAVV